MIRASCRHSLQRIGPPFCERSPTTLCELQTHNRRSHPGQLRFWSFCQNLTASSIQVPWGIKSCLRWSTQRSAASRGASSTTWCWRISFTSWSANMRTCNRNMRGSLRESRKRTWRCRSTWRSLNLIRGHSKIESNLNHRQNPITRPLEVNLPKLNTWTVMSLIRFKYLSGNFR